MATPRFSLANGLSLSCLFSFYDLALLCFKGFIFVAILLDLNYALLPFVNPQISPTKHTMWFLRLYQTQKLTSSTEELQT